MVVIERGDCSEVCMVKRRWTGEQTSDKVCVQRWGCQRSDSYRRQVQALINPICGLFYCNDSYLLIQKHILGWGYGSSGRMLAYHGFLGSIPSTAKEVFFLFFCLK
jgi:hypothetical protein